MPLTHGKQNKLIQYDEYNIPEIKNRKIKFENFELQLV